jgi:hypothetical protein
MRAILMTLNINMTVMDIGKETIKREDGKLLLDAFQFVGISRRNRIPNNRGRVQA